MTAGNARQIDAGGGEQRTGGVTPVLSIVICTRNRAGALSRALDAIGAMDSSQTYEVIVVDNNSSDHTTEVVGSRARKDPRVRCVSEATPGLGAARERGWRLARGSLIAFVDDDIVVPPDFADRMIEVFTDRPTLGFVAGQIRLGNPADLPLTIDLRGHPEDMPPYSLVSTTSVAGANLAFRRACLVAIGGWDTALGAGTPFPCEDLDAVTRAIWAGWPGGYDPRPVVYHHHGRRSAGERSSLLRSYDRGRGAYYAKFILRPDTRRTYLRAYLHWLLHAEHRPGDVLRVWREATAGLRYWWLVHRHPVRSRRDETPTDMRPGTPAENHP